MEVAICDIMLERLISKRSSSCFKKPIKNSKAYRPGISPEKDAWFTAFFIENHLDPITHPAHAAPPEQVRFMVYLDEDERYYPCSNRMFEAIMGRDNSRFLAKKYQEVLQRVMALIADQIEDQTESQYLESLIKICELNEEDPSLLISWHKKLSNAINKQLWSDETNQFYDWDVLSNETIDSFTLANCIPLILNSLTQKQIDSIFNRLKKNGEFWNEGGFPLSSIPLKSPEFNSQNYWRGPVWINMNWLIIQGLKKHGFTELSIDLAVETIRLVSESGFYEYFDPLTGEGCGSDNFSWTAALIIDLITNLQK